MKLRWLPLVALMGCSDPQSHEDPRFTILPADVPYLHPGQSLLFRAVSNDGASVAVHWESTNTSVATVDADGRVSGLMPGETWIKAVSVSGRRDSVHLVVVPAAPKGPLSVLFLEIYLHGTTTPALRTDVKGTIDVRVAYDVPAGVSATTLSVTFNGRHACAYTLTTNKGAETCALDTRSFTNGLGELRAVLLGSTGATLASATMTLTLAN